MLAGTEGKYLSRIHQSNDSYLVLGEGEREAQIYEELPSSKVYISVLFGFFKENVFLSELKHKIMICFLRKCLKSWGRCDRCCLIAFQTDVLRSQGCLRMQTYLLAH